MHRKRALHTRYPPGHNVTGTVAVIYPVRSVRRGYEREEQPRIHMKGAGGGEEEGCLCGEGEVGPQRRKIGVMIAGRGVCTRACVRAGRERVCVCVRVCVRRVMEEKQ